MQSIAIATPEEWDELDFIETAIAHRGSEARQLTRRDGATITNIVSTAMREDVVLETKPIA